MIRIASDSGRSHSNANAHQYPTSRAQSLDMTTRIPAELIFHIVSFLRDNKAALSACSLCCSALSTVSRPLLFHTLRTSLISGAADRFECLLESGPEVLTLIKRVDVTVAISTPEFIVVNRRTIAAVSQIMASHRIQDTPPTLGITIRTVSPLSHGFEQLLLSRLDPVVHWVTSLELGRLDLTGDVQFWDLVLAFPRLKSLILGGVSVGARARTPSHCESEISHITLKEPALGSISDIHRLFYNHPLPLPSLTSLDVRFPTPLGRAPIRFGVVYAPTVRTLRFGIAIVPHPTISWNKLGCDACKF